MTPAPLLIALASLAAADPGQPGDSGQAAEKPVERRDVTLSLGLLGGVALGAGTPAWAGGDFGFEQRFLRRGLWGASGRLRLGNDEQGAPLGGWGAALHLGIDCFDSARISLRWLARAGVTTVAWVPAPNLALENEFFGAPLLFTHFRWRLGLSGAVEFPWRAGGELWTEVAVLAGGFAVGLRAMAGAHVGVDLAGVGAGLRLQLERSF